MKRRQHTHHSSARVIELAILIGLPILTHVLIPITILIPKPYNYLGILVMILGMVVMMQASQRFRDAGTGFDLESGGAALVTDGPFRFSRNPMYLGMLCWLIGLAILLGSLMAFFFPLLLFGLANFVFIPIEERELEQSLGQPYLAYKTRVRRWL